MTHCQEVLLGLDVGTPAVEVTSGRAGMAVDGPRADPRDFRSAAVR